MRFSKFWVNKSGESTVLFMSCNAGRHEKKFLGAPLKLSYSSSRELTLNFNSSYVWHLFCRTTCSIMSVSAQKSGYLASQSWRYKVQKSVRFKNSNFPALFSTTLRIYKNNNKTVQKSANGEIVYKSGLHNKNI